MTTNPASSARGLLIAIAAAMLAMGMAACSSSSSTSSGGSHTTAPKAKAASAPKTKTASPLSGKWSGHYSGAYNGTFALTWRQTGSRLHGTIHISNPSTTLPINGTVNGTTIRFGTVGSTAITYTGTVAGNSMSGTYQVHTGNGTPGGPWSASKS